jgi:hypothetical protein
VLENPFTGESHLAGKVFDHPTIRDGLRVISSAVKGGSSKDRVIITASGSCSCTRLSFNSPLYYRYDEELHNHQAA